MDHKNNEVRSRRRSKSKVRKRVVYALLSFVLVIAIIGFINFAKFIPLLVPGATSTPVHLKQTPQKQVNILLLGIGGGTHEGPDLTDTIIFANVDPKNKKATLVSIPRDVWSPDLGAKVNSVYTFAEEKEKGSGLSTDKAFVGKMLGQQIDYAIKIDFDGFVKAVDMVGGLDIDVERTFDDYAYPIGGNEEATCGLSSDTIASLSAQIASGSATEGDSFPCRYEHLHYDKGPAHMDGTNALKYVRSRHAYGIEGSDFSRSRRQAKVITAFKEKVFSAGTVLNPVKLVNLITILKGSIETDITPDEYPDFIKLSEQMKGSKINSTVIDEGDSATGRNGLLINPPISAEFGGAWVLSPRLGNGKYDEIQEYVSCEIQNGNCIVGENGIETPTPTPQVTKTLEK
jgi:LCP family protein required for cell wall assembly